MSIRRPGLPTCSPASPITRSLAWPRCCPGTGAVHPLSSAPPDCGGTGLRDHHPPCCRDAWRGQGPAADLATDMEPEHGRLSIHDIGEEHTIAFTARRDGLPARDAPGMQTQPIIPAALSGWLRSCLLAFAFR